MQRGVPRTVSGERSSRRTARTKERAETTSDADRVTWLFLAGVGSSSSRKNGFRFNTTADQQISEGSRMMRAQDGLTAIEVQIRIVPFGRIISNKVQNQSDKVIADIQNCSI